MMFSGTLQILFSLVLRNHFILINYIPKKIRENLMVIENIYELQ